MGKEVTHQMESNKLNDDELLGLLGWLHESIKNLEEDKKTDEYLKDLKEKMDDYSAEKYTQPIKDYRKKLSGVRYIAKLRGLSFEVPEKE